MDNVPSLKLSEQLLYKELSTLFSTTTELNYTNALALNQEMQRRLEQIRYRILQLLAQVRARYKYAQGIIQRRQKDGSKKTELNFGESKNVSGSFRFKGNLYFRDEDGRSCPNNEDYNKRCASEMFPTDFDMIPKHYWTVIDKRNVVTGIKQQILDHIEYQNCTKQSQPHKRKIIDLSRDSLTNLLRSVDDSFRIDWNQISVIDMECRHSAHSCEAMWRIYLHPDLNHSAWTEEEDEALVAAAKMHNFQDWQAIALATPQRSDFQCFVRMQLSLRHQLDQLRPKWTSDDSERLRNLVSKNISNGTINWSEVLHHFPDRSASTIIGKYMYILQPGISREPFTAAEDMMLFAAVREYNGKFYCFPRTLFPNRSLVQLRTRYHNVLAPRHNSEAWTVRDDTKMMEFVASHGSSNWVQCASYLGNHSRTSCRTRYLVIQRFLQQNENATIEDIPRRRVNNTSKLNLDNWTQRLEEYENDPSILMEDNMAIKPRKKLQKKSLQCLRVPELKGLEKKMYDFFRYSYNLCLRLPPMIPPLPTDDSNLKLVANALQFRPQPSTDPTFIKNISLPRYFMSRYNNMLRVLSWDKSSAGDVESGMLLPPNWSTMMGFRAICILSSPGRKSKRYSPSCPVYDESHPAIALFRRRLRTIFYQTILLSRMPRSTLEHFSEKMSKSTNANVVSEVVDTIYGSDIVKLLPQPEMILGRHRRIKAEDEDIKQEATN